MFAYLSHQQSTNTWESTEAALFIMSGRNAFKKSESVFWLYNDITASTG